MPVAFFDLDGTLITGPPAEALLVAALARAGLLGPRQMAGMLLRQVAALPLGHGVALARNKGYLIGVPAQAVARLGRQAALHLLASALRPAVLERLEAHRRAGDALVLLTAAPEAVAAPLARALGMDCIATRCSVDRSGRLGLPHCLPFGAAKPDLARAACRRAGISLAEAAAYGDSYYDLPLLRAVARPVAVAPDPPLRAAARAAGWTILE